MSSLLSGTVGRQILLKMHSIEISSYSNQEIPIYKLYKVHCVVQGTLTIPILQRLCDLCAESRQKYSELTSTLLTFRSSDISTNIRIVRGSGIPANIGHRVGGLVGYLTQIIWLFRSLL